MTRAIVVGGGLAGLLAAHRLVGNGVQVTLFEAGPVPGGQVRPVEIGGLPVDAGAEGYAVRGGHGRALSESLGLDVAGPSGRSWVWRPGGAHPMAQGVLGIPASFSDEALSALSDAGLAAARRDRELAADVGADATTIGELVRARLGDELLERLVAPVVRGVYAADPDRLPLDRAAPGLLPALAEAGTLVEAVGRLRSDGAPPLEQPIGGMFQLTRALADAVARAGGEIFTDAPVDEIRREGEGWRVSADGRGHDADRLVLAAPAAETARLLRGVGIEIEAPQTRASRVVVLGVRASALTGAPDASGVLIAERSPDVAAKALTQYSTKWPWARTPEQGIVRFTYPADSEVTPGSALADAALLLGVELTDADVTGFAIQDWRMPGRLPDETRDRLLGECSALGIDVVGAWFDGNGIASVIEGCARVN